MPRAAVVGGGISGLAAAYEFHLAGWEVDVYEASDRWGGKIVTSPVGAEMVDSGPDAVLMRAPAGVGLCEELGLDAEFTHPIAPKPAYIYWDGTLHVLPTGTVLGVPVDLGVLDTSTLFSDTGRADAARDLALPPTRIDGDMSVGELSRTRLGAELTDRLIDPLIGGINASDIDRLSLRAAAPLLAKAVDQHGSLIKGMAALYPNIGAALGATRDGRDSAATPTSPVFFSLPGGVARIVQRLVEELPSERLHLGHPVDDLGASGVRDADAVVVATPAPVAAQILHGDADNNPASELLARIAYAGVSQATVTIPGQEPLDASGILFPRSGGTVLTASTWLSSKWPQYQRSDRALIRLTSGRYGDTRSAEMDDQTLVSTLLGELNEAVPLAAEPDAVRIQRWPNALPQYEPGHLDLVAEIRHAVGASRNGRLRVVGAAYDGIGIPACIDSGRTAARELMA